MPGFVYIIGVGPGAPDLLTLRAIDRLSKAQVVVYGNLVPEIIVEKYAEKAIEKIKIIKKHRKEAIKVVIDRALRGYVVAHLKNGDPTVYAHLREEIEELERNGIPYEVIPGVTSITAGAIEAKISLTDYPHIRGFAVVNGHDEDVEVMKSLVQRLGMIVILMPSLEKAKKLIQELGSGYKVKTVRSISLDSEVINDIPERYDKPCIVYIYKNRNE